MEDKTGSKEVVIAPWGDPKNWKRVKYQYNNKTNDNFSSSLALSNILKPVETVIILSSTLCRDKKCEYRAIVDDVSESINKHLEDREVRDKPTIWVAPGVGRFTYSNTTLIYKTQHARQTDLYFNYVYYKTLELLEKLNKELNGNLVLHVDLTHGINYMPVLVDEAIQLASNTFASSSGKCVTINVYNSDPLYPFPSKDDTSIILNINNVKKITYDGYNSFLTLLRNALYNTTNFHNTYNWETISDKKTISDNSDKINSDKIDIKLLEKIVKAASMGLLLVVSHKINELKEMYDIINKYFQTLFIDHKIALECKDNEIVYSNKLYREASILHAVTRAITSIERAITSIERAITSIDIKDKDKDKSLIDIEDKDKDKEISLDKLENLSKIYYEKVMKPIHVLITQEIDSIKKIKGISNKPKLYSEIRYNKAFDINKRCKPNKRNLYAHAGIEENVTYLYKKNSKIYLSYKDCIDEVLNNI